MKKKWIGPPNPGLDGTDLGHEIAVRGEYVGNVKPGDVLDVPDELCADVFAADGKTLLVAAPAWSSELWEDVQETQEAPTLLAKKKGDS